MDARRKSLSVAHPRDRVLSVRMTKEEYEGVEAAARANGMTKAEYVMAALDAVGEVQPVMDAAARLHVTVGGRRVTVLDWLRSKAGAQSD